MVIVYGLMAVSGLKCAAALCECASSYACERQYVSSHYQYACVQCMGPAAELLQGRPCRSSLILLPREVSTYLHNHVHATCTAYMYMSCWCVVTCIRSPFIWSSCVAVTETNRPLTPVYHVISTQDRTHAREQTTKQTHERRRESTHRRKTTQPAAHATNPPLSHRSYSYGTYRPAYRPVAATDRP